MTSTFRSAAAAATDSAGDRDELDRITASAMPLVSPINRRPCSVLRNFTEFLGCEKWDGATLQPANENVPHSSESWDVRRTALPRSLLTTSLTLGQWHVYGSDGLLWKTKKQASQVRREQLLAQWRSFNSLPTAFPALWARSRVSGKMHRRGV